MIALLLLADITRCVSSQLCPSDAEIVAAVQARDNASVYAVSAQALQDSPEEATLVHSERIRRVSDVICGHALSDTSPPTITCSFTVQYWSRNAYQVARLRRKDGGWTIEDALMVTRDRR